MNLTRLLKRSAVYECSDSVYIYKEKFSFLLVKAPVRTRDTSQPVPLSLMKTSIDKNSIHARARDG